MKIVLLSNLFPNPVEPVRGMFNFHIAKHLVSLGHKVTVVSPLPYFPAIKALQRMQTWYKFSQIPTDAVWGDVRALYPKYPMIPKISDALQAFFMIPVLFKVLSSLQRSEGIDVVNAHYLYPDGVAACKVCNWLNIPIVLSALGSDVNVLAGKQSVSAQIKHALSDCSAITAVSEDLATKMKTMGNFHGKIHVFPNGVDLSLFAIRDKKVEREKAGWPADKKVILYVGRLSPEKGVDCLLEAARILKREQTNITIIVIGGGAEEKRLKALSETLGLTDTVRFLGEQSPAEINRFLGLADLLCLPSIREGCPNVILEAFASGRPVVGSQVGGIPEMINNGENGFLFRAGDAKDLADALDKTLRMNWDTESIRKSVELRTWHAVSEKYITLYKKVAAKQN